MSLARIEVRLAPNALTRLRSLRHEADLILGLTAALVEKLTPYTVDEEVGRRVGWQHGNARAWAVWDEKPALTRPLWRFMQLLLLLLAAA